jgi:hypothetical protein
MPSKSPEQARLMHAIAHGWRPTHMQSPPSREVATEFTEADKRKQMVQAHALMRKGSR